MGEGCSGAGRRRRRVTLRSLCGDGVSVRRRTREARRSGVRAWGYLGRGAVSEGAELPVSTFRTHSHCEGRRLLSASQRRWAMHCRLFRTMYLPHVLSYMCLPRYGVRVAMAFPRNGGNIAPPRWLLPTLPYSPPHANQRGVQLHGGMEQQGGTPCLKMRVEPLQCGRP